MIRPTPPRLTAIAAILTTLLLGSTACGGAEATDAAKLAADAELPDQVPEGTVLRLGIPPVEVALKESGLIDEVEGYEIEWANISGGPKSIEAFRAGALDASYVADIPPLFATWTDTPVRIAAVTENPDPLEDPIYELGIAPESKVETLEDLKGKKIAYSPGQAQGALVLKTLDSVGLTQDDVELVEIQSVDDTYANALASNQVDVAPLGGPQLTSYLAKYGRDGATSVRTGIRDDAMLFYGPEETFQDAAKAAAFKDFLGLWVKAEKWIDEHPDEWVQAYYVDHEGLTFEDGKAVYETSGQRIIPEGWDEFIERHQETADILVKDQGQPEIDVEELYDRRYETVIADAVQEGQ
ncbi:ABC transporter substrate-binding protein [Nocardioides albus]|uniref:Sulfonate transport system substrate-binding protein n=1 Tax=Nocardioides albus TaxID=1841 RepID=A0A7W5A012_9ACTN|nr:ABC transporter substrate-binding protein [Nocardioides albus]MBB3087187.1 sulfonate transport system substrate-binding protein [Nocardioides albus]GGU07241.1 ABC transporter substrate-binding protein [Nocardioides albus]